MIRVLNVIQCKHKGRHIVWKCVEKVTVLDAIPDHVGDAPHGLVANSHVAVLKKPDDPIKQAVEFDNDVGVARAGNVGEKPNGLIHLFEVVRVKKGRCVSNDTGAQHEIEWYHFLIIEGNEFANGHETFLSLCAVAAANGGDCPLDPLGYTELIAIPITSCSTSTRPRKVGRRHMFLHSFLANSFGSLIPPKLDLGDFPSPSTFTLGETLLEVLPPKRKLGLPWRGHDAVL